MSQIFIDFNCLPKPEHRHYNLWDIFENTVKKKCVRKLET